MTIQLLPDALTQTTLGGGVVDFYSLCRSPLFLSEEDDSAFQHRFPESCASEIWLVSLNALKDPSRGHLNIACKVLFGILPLCALDSEYAPVQLSSVVTISMPRRDRLLKQFPTMDYQFPSSAR